MKEDIWEEGYVDYKPFGKEFAMPEGWKKHFSNNGHLKLGPIRKFYDAENAEELIYKYAAAAAWDLYRIGANARTGNPEYKQLEKENVRGIYFGNLMIHGQDFIVRFMIIIRSALCPIIL